MQLIYTPEDGQRQVFEYKPGRLRSSEAVAIERAGDGSWESYSEFGSKLLNSNREALRALLWLMLRRTDPNLQLDQVDPMVEELDLDWDEEEKRRLEEAEADALGKDKPDTSPIDSG